MNYYKVRIEQFKNNGYEEVAIFWTKAKAIECIRRLMTLKPYHWEIVRGCKIISDDKEQRKEVKI